MKLLLLLLLFAATIHSIACFQSDELPEDDEEWGLVGGTTGSKIRAEKPEKEYIGSGSPRTKRTPSATSVSGPATDSTGDKKIQFTLEHSLGVGAEFAPAGLFSARLRASAHGRQTLSKLRLARNPFSESEQKAFEDLVSQDGVYKVRVPANVVNPGNTYVMASMKARCLAAASLKERFDLNLVLNKVRGAQDQSNLIGITYTPAGDCSYPRPKVFPSSWTFDSLIVTKTSEHASRLTSTLEDIPQIKEGEKVIENEDGTKVIVEKTFWQKYWMYIVPFGLIVINAVTQIANMPDDAPPAQGGAAPAGVAPQRISGPGGGRRR